MTILLLLIPISLALLGVAVWAFVWAVRRGQFDDLDSAALDILSDERATAGSGLDRRAAGSPATATTDTDTDAPRPARADASDHHAD